MNIIIPISCVVACLAMPAQLFSQTALSSRANLTDVTVYNGSAELNHNATVRLPAGTSEVVFTHIASSIDPNSIQVGSSSSVVVLSARASLSPSVENTKSADYRAQEAIYKAELAKLTALRNESEAEASVLNLLVANQKISTEGTALTMEAITRMADYHRGKYLASKTAISKLAEEIKEQELKVNHEKAILDGLEGQNTAAAGQLIVQVINNQAGEQPFRISYATPSASWSASYDLRAADVRSPLDIVYKANVWQQTGVDWDKVNLTLATGNPSQSGSIAELNPWNLYYYEQYNDRSSRKLMLKGSALSGVANAEMAAAPQALNDYVDMGETQLSNTFKIDIPYSIASNGVSHAVTLQDYKHPANYTYQAVPKLDEQVYLVAELVDYEKLNLLPGPANIVFENMLVGKTHVNPQISTDTLKLSMGRDNLLSVKREKVNDLSQTKTFGSSKRQTLVYELTLKNNKKSEVSLQVQDQYPLSTDKAMEISLDDVAGAAVDAERGMLTWNVQLKPGEVKKIRFGYSIKYPKDKVVQLF